MWLQGSYTKERRIHLQSVCPITIDIIIYALRALITNSSTFTFYSALEHASTSIGLYSLSKPDIYLQNKCTCTEPVYALE